MLKLTFEVKLTVKTNIYVQRTVTAVLILFMFIISFRIEVDQNFVAAFRLAEIKNSEYRPTLKLTK